MCVWVSMFSMWQIPCNFLIICFEHVCACVCVCCGRRPQFVKQTKGAIQRPGQFNRDTERINKQTQIYQKPMILRYFYSAET